MRLNKYIDNTECAFKGVHDLVLILILFLIPRYNIYIYGVDKTKCIPVTSTVLNTYALYL